MISHHYRIFIFSLIFPIFGYSSDDNYRPKEGYVPDSETAIKIAVAVWTPIYGEATIREQKPYTATLKRNIWLVTGSLPKNMVGGTAIAEISKTDGRILRIIHEK